jgi:hypothetical protein
MLKNGPLRQRLVEGGSDHASSRKVNGHGTARARAQRAAAAVPVHDELATAEHQTLRILDYGVPLKLLSVGFLSLG